MRWRRTEGTPAMRFLSSLLTLLAVIAAVVVLIAAPWPLLLGATLLLGVWLWLTRIGRQAASVTGIRVSTLTQRPGASFVIIIGIGGVVAELVRSEERRVWKACRSRVSPER